MRSFIHSHKRSSSLDNTSSKTAVTRNSNGSTTDLLPPYIPTAEPKHSGSLESLHKIASGKIFSNKLFKKSGSNNSKQSLVGEGHPFRKQRGEQTNFNGYKYDGGDVFDDIPAIKGTRTHEWGDNGEVPHSVIILNGTSMQGNALYNQMKDGCVSTKLTRRSLDCNSITSSSQDEATLLSNACESSVGSASAIHLRSRGAQGAIKKQNRQARIHSSDDILELELNSSWRTGIVTSMDEHLVAEMNENSSTQEYGNLAEDELEGTDMHSYSSSSDRSSKFSFETGSGKNGRTSSQKYYAKVEPVAPRYIDDIYVDEDLDEDMNYCASDGKEDEDTTHLFCFSDAGGGAANYSTLCNLGTDESDISDDITDMPKTPVDVASNLADYESFDSPTEEAGHEQVEGDLFTEAISDNYSLDEQTTNIEDEIYRELDLPIAYSLKSKESGSDVSRNRELKVEQYISQSPDLEDPCSSNLVLDEGHVTEGVLACNNESLELQETAEQLSSLYISKDEETSSLRLFQAERRTSIAKCNSPAQITFKEAKIAVEASPAPTIIKKYADLFCLSDDEDGAASQKNEELQSYSDQYPIGDSTKVYITNIIDDQDNHDEEQRDLGSSKYPLSPGSDAYPVYSNQPTLQVHGLVAQDQPMTKPFQTSVRNVAPSLPPPARSQSLKYHDLHSSLDAEINGTMSNLYFIDESEEDKYNASQVKSEDDYIDEINTVPEDFTFSDSETEPWSAKSSPRPFPERNSFRKTHSFSDKPTGQVKEGSPVPYRLDLKNKTVTFFKNGLSKATLDFVGNTGRSVSHSFLSMPSYTSRCDVRMGKTDDSKTINIDIIKATDARSMTKVSDCLITKEMHELAPIEEGI